MKLLAALLLPVMSLPAQTFRPVDETSYASLVASERGRVLLVNFWATWCAPCRKEMPLLAKMADKLRSRGFSFLTVSADEPEQEASALAFLLKASIRPPFFLKRAKDDDRFISRVDAGWSGALPLLVLYDRAGKRVRTWVGEPSLAEVEAAIMKLL